MPWPILFGPPPRITTLSRSDLARIAFGADDRLQVEHVGRFGGEFGGTGVDPLVDRMDAGGLPRGTTSAFGTPASMAIRVRKPIDFNA